MTLFITGKDMNVLCRQLNEDLRNIQEWLQCNKLSLNVLKTHYMVFTPRNKLIDDIEVKIHHVQIQRVYTTKFLGVQIDSQLTWKMHIEYTCKKLSKCVGILCKARKKLYKSTLISLYSRIPLSRAPLTRGNQLVALAPWTPNFSDSSLAAAHMTEPVTHMC